MIAVENQVTSGVQQDGGSMDGGNDGRVVHVCRKM